MKDLNKYNFGLDQRENKGTIITVKMHCVRLEKSSSFFDFDHIYCSAAVK